MDTFILVISGSVMTALSLVLVVMLYAVLVPVDIIFRYTLVRNTAAFSWRVSWGIFAAQNDPERADTIQVCFLGRHLVRFTRQETSLPEEGSTKNESNPEVDLYQRMRTAIPLLRNIAPVFLESVHLRKCTCTITFGMSGPAQTGCLYGWLSAARGILSAIPHLTIHLVPVFDHPVLDIDTDAELRISFPLLTAIRVYRVLRNQDPSQDMGSHSDLPKPESQVPV